MTFEQAWPLIKQGKEFKVTWSDTKNTTEWITAKEISYVPLNVIGSSEFQIKSEPKEWTIQVGVPFTIPPENFLKVGQVIKLREVVE